MIQQPKGILHHLTFSLAVTGSGGRCNERAHGPEAMDGHAQMRHLVIMADQL